VGEHEAIEEAIRRWLDDLKARARNPQAKSGMPLYSEKHPRAASDVKIHARCTELEATYPGCRIEAELGDGVIYLTVRPQKDSGS
jgi:hypothetical protein